MNKKQLRKGMKRMGGFLLLCFVAPVVIYQAFKNQSHPFFWPVFILGMMGFFYAIFLGFIGIKTLVNALLGPPRIEKPNS